MTEGGRGGPSRGGRLLYLTLALAACGADTEAEGDAADLGSPVEVSSAAHRFRAISGGAYHFCGILESGDALCWGCGSERDGPACAGLDFGQGGAPYGTYTSVVAGGAGTCGVLAEGDVRCWGLPAIASSAPAQVRVAAVAVADRGACAIRVADARLTCWGIQPLAPPPGRYTEISAGWNGGFCALSETGALVCWGAMVADAPAGAFVRTSLGDPVHCAIDEAGALTCWGAASLDGALQAPPEVEWADVAMARGGAAIGLDTQGVVHVWNTSSAPTFQGRFRQIATSANVACALDDEGLVHCASLRSTTDQSGAARPP